LNPKNGLTTQEMNGISEPSETAGAKKPPKKKKKT
jgi:hypothetical protein